MKIFVIALFIIIFIQPVLFILSLLPISLLNRIFRKQEDGKKGVVTEQDGKAPQSMRGGG